VAGSIDAASHGAHDGDNWRPEILEWAE